MRELQVNTRYGALKGQNINGVAVWKGIPYARPPVNELRFEAPERPDSWEGVKEADQFGPECIQPRTEGGLFQTPGYEPKESEDCLYLNVWAPEQVAEQKLPVMVWIHGGAFVSGSGSTSFYDATQFVKRGEVIVVTMNYRLGPFGFMHLSPLGESFISNAGLLDQIAALEWVQENIDGFGGDPGAVTVFGESAGSMSIAALMAMPKAKGLFQQAIMQSGASQHIPAEQAAQVTAGMLQMLGIGSDEVHKLKTLPAEQILAAGERFKEQTGAGLALLFQPVVDQSTLPKSPVQAIKDGDASDVRLLIGTNLDEGALFIRPESEIMNDGDIVRAMEMMTGVPNGHEIVSQYPKSTDGQAQLMTDLFFWRSSVQFAAAQSKYAPVFMYRFDWTLEGHPLLNKAIHAGEIAFVFHNLQFFTSMGITPNDSMQQLASTMQDAWIAFAKGEVPVPGGHEWPPYSIEHRATMIFGTNIEMIQDPNQEKRIRLGL
ncbi:para-nitrobenzyl esterase [Paenibacillus sp. J45TS6]|uniref:carboxylesterase/lipase family protein n=1 Tax=Paenibacillus sp. J45TS6 TaxID=2807196 RepID=UPI001AFDCF97|nr:carboxylesterase/lipase family protein [Paenibacillus sp. J45TS6]GIP42869.1 para-nitrobenzyl esterase [Paenibacillus sp. J45TS6]